MNSFLTVGEQVLILFLLMVVGFVCNKAKILSKEANKRISDLVVILVAPCVIIQSFERDYDAKLLWGIGISVIIAAVIHILMIAISHFVFAKESDIQRRVLRFGAVFSNAGFVALPLQSALLGAEGTLYGASYLVVFNIVLWSYGIYEMSGDKANITAGKIILSPGIVSVTVGIILFLFSVKLPNAVNSAIGYIAALNVPLPMIIVGYYIAETNIFDALKDLKCVKCMFMRLIVFPFLSFLVLYLCGVRGIMLSAAVIATSAPVGATTTMFSERFGADTSLSAKLVSVSTLISTVTMPVIIGLAQTVA